MRTSEYVSIGHPDKIADYISEYILDRLIEQDPHTRYALEVQIKDEDVNLAGEITTKAKTDYDKWVKEAVKDIGYTADYALKWGTVNTISADDLKIHKYISQQSSDIAQGVDNDAWGDQGIFWGMATNNQNCLFLPSDYFLARRLCQELYNSSVGGLDIKTQVTVDDNDKPIKVIVAIPLLNEGNEKVIEIIKKVIGPGDYDIIINGTGRYVKHASKGDCGITGRKLVVDFYGSGCEIGGGSPWTKDGTKADLALNLKARSMALEALKIFDVDYAKVQLACCIGKQEVSYTVWDKCGKVLNKGVSIIKPSTMIRDFKLDKPLFAKRCKLGLFGYENER